MLSSLFFSFLLILLTLVSSELIFYHHDVLFPLKPQFITIPKFSRNEVPNWSPGRGRSFIDLGSLTVHSSCDSSMPPSPPSDGTICKEVEIDLLMFEAPLDKSWIDYWGDDDYCCNENMFENGKCNNKGSLYVPRELPNSFLRTLKVIPNEPTQVSELAHHDISSSGLYVILMSLCDSTSRPVVIDGSIESIDPYGYVPADQFAFVPFYFFLSAIYFIIGVAWIVLCIAYRDDLMPLQTWISAVMAIGLLETTVLFLKFVNWNDFGTPVIGLTTSGVFLGVLKRSLSRVLVQLVSLGYGVVRPSLGDEMGRVVGLGGVYCFVSLVYAALSALPNSSRPADGPTYDLLSIAVFSLAVVDTTFYIWVFTSINNLITSLAARRQVVKWMLYKNFRNILVTLLIFACVWTIYSSSIFLKDVGGSQTNWKEKWTVEASWECIYLVVLVSIAILWAPSKNAQRYAHSMEIGQQDDDWEIEMSEDAAALESSAPPETEEELDGECGGRLNDEKDPFQGTGALDPAMAIHKKN